MTRPQVGAERTAARLRALGHTPHLLPLFTPEFLPVETLPEADSLVATSANAIRALTATAPPENLTKIPLFTVGRATAKAAREAGYTNVSSADGTGADLARLILSQPARPEKLLYLAGEPRSPQFEAELQAEGLPFKTVTLYRMAKLSQDPATLDAAFKSPPDVILLYSREAATRFFEIAEPYFAAIVAAKSQILCLSPNIAIAVPEVFKSQLQFAPVPEEDALLALIST